MNRTYSQNLWIVTDVDGTLMDHQYDLSPALPTISFLQKIGIPVILCTSKTASEVRIIRKNIGINDPYIVENGGAIYGGEGDSHQEWQIILGKSYSELRDTLDKLSQEIGYHLVALNDMNFKDINQLTGLNDKEIPLALDRHWSVPFLNPPDDYNYKLSQLLDKYDISIYRGNRMSHLLNKGSHKGKAVKALKDFFQNQQVKVIALGDSHNDYPLLEAADEAIVIPGLEGPNKYLLDNLKGKNFHVASKPHAEGWSELVNLMVKKYIKL